MVVNKLIYSGAIQGVYESRRFYGFMMDLCHRKDNGVRAQDLRVNVENTGLKETTFHMPCIGVGVVYRKFGEGIAQVRLLAMKEGNVSVIEKIILEEAAKLPT